MPWERPLIEGVLLRRRERFLADVRLSDGTEVVAHCVNTGRMEGLTLPGRRAWIMERPAGAGKLRYTWMVAERPRGGTVDDRGGLIGADTSFPNRLVWKMLNEGVLPGHTREKFFRREVPWHDGRVDFWLGPDPMATRTSEPSTRRRATLIEVKNCHLVYPDGHAYFPDSVSERATKHLHSLLHAVRMGHRAEVLFVVQCGYAKALRPSDAHDPVFAAALREVAKEGVRVRAILARPTLAGSEVTGLLRVDLAPYDVAPALRYREILRAEAPAWERNPRIPRPPQGTLLQQRKPR